MIQEDPARGSMAESGATGTGWGSPLRLPPEAKPRAQKDLRRRRSVRDRRRSVRDRRRRLPPVVGLEDLEGAEEARVDAHQGAGVVELPAVVWG